MMDSSKTAKSPPVNRYMKYRGKSDSLVTTPVLTGEMLYLTCRNGKSL
jgi:hypothetical protein